MTDREQIRRDAEAMIAIHGENAKLAHGVVALLAELEQAERDLANEVQLHQATERKDLGGFGENPLNKGARE